MSCAALFGVLTSFVVAPQNGSNFHPVQESPYVLLQGNYDPGQPWDCGGASSACNETRVAVSYPPGSGPLSLGYAPAPKPVLVTLRGGNENSVGMSVPPGWFEAYLHPAGFVGVQPNFPIVGDTGGTIGGTTTGGTLGGWLGGGSSVSEQPTEDYETIVAALGYLIQHLRRYAVELNIDPDSVFVLGRSGGAVWAYALALRYDYADPTSGDLTEHVSSRPDGICVFSGPTAFDCLSPTSKFGAQMKAFFPQATAPGATLQDKVVISPWYWLENPELFGRTVTPPMFLGYSLSFWGEDCGDTSDVHSGAFGYWMKQHLDGFVASTYDAALGKQSVLFDSNDFLGLGFGVPEAVAWCQDVMRGPKAGMKLVLDGGGWLLKPAHVATWKSLGSSPGHLVGFFFGPAQGDYSFACGAEVPWRIGPQVFLLGVDTADLAGMAQTSVFIPAGPTGLTAFVQTFDPLSCAVSDLMTIVL